MIRFLVFEAVLGILSFIKPDMKCFVKTSFYKPEKFNDERTTLSLNVFQEMEARWPKFKKEGLRGLHIRVEVGSVLQKEVFDFLASHGRTPCWIRRGPATPLNVFHLDGERIFESEDLVGAEFVRPECPPSISDRVMYHGDCEVWVDGPSIEQNLDLGAGGGCDLPIVRDHVKAQIQAEGWKGLTFREVEIRDAPSNQCRLWLLWPDHEMPPVLDPVVDTRGRPFDPEQSDSCYIQDLYIPTLYRYSKNGLALPEGACAFRTHERFGANKVYWGTGTRKPNIILRIEFGEWLLSKGWLKELMPVILE